MFEIRVKTGVDWDRKEGIVIAADNEYEYYSIDTYKIDVEKVEMEGISYLDSLFKQCISDSVDKLIANRIEFRKQIKNVYEDFNPLVGIDG